MTGNQVAFAQHPTAGHGSSCTPGELVSQRTRQTKTILHEDCSYTTTFGANLHYEVQPGRWEEVDLRFRRNGESQVADRNSTVVRVSGARLEVTDRDSGRGVIWVLPARPATSGHHARFTWRGLDWTYAVTDLGVKLEADVANPRGPQTYEFPYQLIGGADGLVVDDRGDLRGDGFHVPRAFALGADGQIYQASPWELLQGRAVFDFDDSVLPQDAFPYVLDPTTSFSPTAAGDEGDVTKSGFPYPPSSCTGWSDSGSTIRPERSTNAKSDPFWTTSGFMSWDTSSLPDNATVTSSTLKFYSEAKADSNGRNLTADWYSAWPIDCGDFSDSAQTSAIAGIPLSAIPTPNLDTITTLSGAAGGVSRTGRTGLRAHISGGQPTGANSLGIWQLGNSSNMPSPQLNVDYSLSNDPPVVTFTVTPTSGDRSTVFAANFNGTYDPNNDPITYRIDWGDGTVNTSQSASHRYQNAGTYTVTGRACDGFGACSSTSRSVTVAFSNEPPSAHLTVNPTTGDTRTTFNATLTGSDPDGDSVTYRIDWGDGTTTSGQSGTHTYASPGRYTVVGVVTDSYGEEGVDTEDVTVCTLYEGGQCGEQPEEPAPPPIPNVLRPVWSAVARVVQQKPEPARLVRSDTNEIMVLNANLIQAYARGHRPYHDTCKKGSHKTCGADIRLERFANRIVGLVRKPGSDTGDGMGGVVPDVILLQEVLKPHARTIANQYLDKRFNERFDFGVAAGFADPDIENNEAEVAYCAKEDDTATPEQNQACADDIVTKGDSAIIYNQTTVQRTQVATIDNEYHPDDRCEPGSGAPSTGWDFDLDLQGDCEYAKWKRQVMAGFVELDAEGNVVETAYRVAVASTHFVTASHFDNQIIPQDVEDEVEEQQEDDLVHQEKKLEWSDQMADEIQAIPADSYVIAGDLNIHRCTNKNHRRRGDYPDDEPECPEFSWYTNMTTSPEPAPEPAPTPTLPPVPAPGEDSTPTPRGYTDTVRFLHADEDDRLIPQYRDGEFDGGGPRFRPKRIDYIFSRSAEILESSFDLTCGEDPSNQDILPNCGDYRNRNYYSDHRIIWTLFSEGPSE